MEKGAGEQGSLPPCSPAPLHLTRAGREIAQQRLAFVEAFIAQVDEECGLDLEGL